MHAGIKASLTTLELVHASSRSNDTSLSNDEVEAAHRSLDEITRLTSKIKDKLPTSLLSASADKDMNDIDESMDESSSQSSISSLPNAASVAKAGILKKKPPDDNDYGDTSTNDDHQPQRRFSIGRMASSDDNDQPQRRLSIGQFSTNDEPQRRLSIGQVSMVPNDSMAETQDGAAKQGKARQKQGVSFFSRGHNTVHPVDIETGSGVRRNSSSSSSGGVRRNRFSKTIQRKDSELAGTWKMTAREAFRIIDENGDGFLQKEEVVRAIEMMVEHGEMGLDGMTSIELAEKMMNEVE